MNAVGEMQIGKVNISPALVLAPMAGVTDSSFRRLIKELTGVGLIVTEFISVEGLTRGNIRTHRMMKFLPEERPLSIQIFAAQDRLRCPRAEALRPYRARHTRIGLRTMPARPFSALSSAQKKLRTHTYS